MRTILIINEGVLRRVYIPKSNELNEYENKLKTMTREELKQEIEKVLNECKRTNS